MDLILHILTLEKSEKNKNNMQILTSAISSIIVLMHSTTLSDFPPTRTTRSVDCGQHSWNSLMLV